MVVEIEITPSILSGPVARTAKGRPSIIVQEEMANKELPALRIRESTCMYMYIRNMSTAIILIFGSVIQTTDEEVSVGACNE